MVVAFGTMCSALPVFLTGALGVQLRDDVGLSATQIGLAMGSSFVVAATLSAPMGRLAQRLGPRRGFRCGLATTGLAMLLLAVGAREFWHFCAILGIAGSANSLNQPSANLLLATHVSAERLGFALATKQSGMPAAALLGGAAVPAVALTLGWQWAFGFGAVFAAMALLLQPRDRRPDAGGRVLGDVEPAAPGSASSVPTRPLPDLGLGLLLLYALVGLLGATSAGAMVGFITSGAEASGLGAGVSGLVLSLGSLVGIISRIAQGVQVDRRGVLPIQRLVWLFGLGGLGVLLLGVDQPVTYLLAPIPAFAFGWAWPGLFNLSVIRNNPSAPAAATGISQVGVFAGAAIGPIAGGLIIDNSSYRVLWAAASSTLLVGAFIAMYLRSRIKADRIRHDQDHGRLPPLGPTTGI